MKSTLVTITALAAALTLAGCGGSSPAAPAGTSATTTGSGAIRGNGGANGAARIPGTSGLIAAVNGSTMQVQGNKEQVAVTWSATTAMTKTVPGRAADLVVGSCVVVRDASAAPAGGTSAPSARKGPVTATDVQVSQPADAKCTATGFGGPGAGGGGARGRRPTGTSTLPPSAEGTSGGGKPTGGSTAGPGGGAGRGAAELGVVGTVTAVTGSSVTVRREARQNGTATTTATPREVTVTTTSTTSYEKVEPASGADVSVGQCVTALGKADDTGAVAATSIALRPATNGSCTLGSFGGGRSGRPSGTTTGATRG